MVSSSYVTNHPLRSHGRALSPFNGYHGQLFYASACIRTAMTMQGVNRLTMYRQAEAHLCNALGAANVQGAAGDLSAKASLGNIMKALNGVRRSIERHSNV